MDDSHSFDKMVSSLLDVGGHGCASCQALQKQLEQSKAEHSSKFLSLKKKIISTDLLISKYKEQAKELSQCKTSLDSLIGKIKLKDEELNMAESKLSWYKKDYEELLSAQRGKESRLSALQIEADRANNEVAALKTVKNQLSLRVESLEQQCNEEKALVSQLKAKLRDADTSKASGLKEKMEKLSEMNMSLKEDIKCLKTELKTQKKEYEKQVKLLQKELKVRSRSMPTKPTVKRKQSFSDCVSESSSDEHEISENLMGTANRITNIADITPGSRSQALGNNCTRVTQNPPESHSDVERVLSEMTSFNRSRILSPVRAVGNQRERISLVSDASVPAMKTDITKPCRRLPSANRKLSVDTLGINEISPPLGSVSISPPLSSPVPSSRHMELGIDLSDVSSSDNDDDDVDDQQVTSHAPPSVSQSERSSTEDSIVTYDAILEKPQTEQVKNSSQQETYKNGDDGEHKQENSHEKITAKPDKLLKPINPAVKKIVRRAAPALADLDICSRKYPMRDKKELSTSANKEAGNSQTVEAVGADSLEPTDLGNQKLESSKKTRVSRVTSVTSGSIDETLCTSTEPADSAQSAETEDEIHEKKKESSYDEVQIQGGEEPASKPSNTKVLINRTIPVITKIQKTHIKKERQARDSWEEVISRRTRSKPVMPSEEAESLSQTCSESKSSESNEKSPQRVPSSNDIQIEEQPANRPTTLSQGDYTNQADGVRAYSLRSRTSSVASHSEKESEVDNQVTNTPRRSSRGRKVSEPCEKIVVLRESPRLKNRRIETEATYEQQKDIGIVQKTNNDSRLSDEQPASSEKLGQQNMQVINDEYDVTLETPAPSPKDEVVNPEQTTSVMLLEKEQTEHERSKETSEKNSGDLCSMADSLRSITPPESVVDLDIDDAAMENSNNSNPSDDEADLFIEVLDDEVETDGTKPDNGKQCDSSTAASTNSVDLETPQSPDKQAPLSPTGSAPGSPDFLFIHEEPTIIPVLPDDCAQNDVVYDNSHNRLPSYIASEPSPATELKKVSSAESVDTFHSSSSPAVETAGSSSDIEPTPAVTDPSNSPIMSSTASCQSKTASDERPKGFPPRRSLRIRKLDAEVDSTSEPQPKKSTPSQLDITSERSVKSKVEEQSFQPKTQELMMSNTNFTSTESDTKDSSSSPTRVQTDSITEETQAGSSPVNRTVSNWKDIVIKMFEVLDLPPLCPGELVSPFESSSLEGGESNQSPGPPSPHQLQINAGTPLTGSGTIQTTGKTVCNPLDSIRLHTPPAIPGMAAIKKAQLQLAKEIALKSLQAAPKICKGKKTKKRSKKKNNQTQVKAAIKPKDKKHKRLGYLDLDGGYAPAITNPGSSQASKTEVLDARGRSVVSYEDALF